jgi:hypothetical protein
MLLGVIIAVGLWLGIAPRKFEAVTPANVGRKRILAEQLTLALSSQPSTLNLFKKSPHP